MPRKNRLNGHLTHLIKEYQAHYQNLINAYQAHCSKKSTLRSLKKRARQKEYVLTITYLPHHDHDKQGFWPASTMLRLRTIDDMVDNSNWATITTTLSPQSYVRKMIAEEIEQYSKKKITIEEYVVRCPFSPNLSP